MLCVSLNFFGVDENYIALIFYEEILCDKTSAVAYNFIVLSTMPFIVSLCDLQRSKAVLPD
jgi:hypothetical protein